MLVTVLSTILQSHGRVKEVLHSGKLSDIKILVQAALEKVRWQHVE
jgi:hypothetical protein